ncbi:HAD-IIA family hydrolase [Kocuria soli]|nr:HAD-IIA family hydrolase [Kocuria soli]
MEAPRTQRLMGTNTWLTDMDGVLVREESMIPGAARLLELWRERGQRFLVLTNNSIYTPRDLSARLARSGLEVKESELWTSALATAEFLREQGAGHRAYVIGEAGLTTAMHEAGFVLTDTDCDYVVLGETRTYSFEAITKAIRLIGAGARFISTNPDTTGPSPEGPLPATGSVAALISAATHRQPYVVGKPNPMMFRSALNQIGAHSETTAMLGDRMDTDIIAGMEAGLATLLVLSGVTNREQVEQYPFRPSAVMESVQDLVNLLELPGPDRSVDG